MKAILDRLPFLESTRFWALILIGVSIALSDAGVVTQTFMDFVWTVAGGHIGIRTADRFAEQFGKKK